MRGQDRKATVVAGWGARPSGQRAERIARASGLACWRLEDGFLRSFGLGDQFPPLSIMIDRTGICYDASRPSDLENLLNSDRDLLAGIAPDVARARQLILNERLSKYNHAPDLDPGMLGPADLRRILVVDQVRGDASVSGAGAHAGSFEAMLAAARRDNPGAMIVVKTHPESVAGRRSGYFTHLADDDRTRVIRVNCNPASLIDQVDQVYVVSSQMGFEALLAGRTVFCFGMPWYAGWGATGDRLECPRRRARRSTIELFAAAYFHSTRYIDPATHRRGTIFEVIEFLAHQRRMAAREPARTFAIGFRRWKQVNVAPMIGLHTDRVSFHRHASQIGDARPGPGDRLLVWGAKEPDHDLTVAINKGAALCRMEDGFIRSVGLGSDLIRPMSLVLDEYGIYFDPRRASGLEKILAETRFQPTEIAQARAIRRRLLAANVTKYNVQASRAANWPARPGQHRILVPGQVADDASVSLGATEVGGNLNLLRLVRQSDPNAFIVYKPHPDVTSRNRNGRLEPREVLRFADHIDTHTGITGCIDACDAVHTLSSLAGFDALLRGRTVVTYGRPFYAGWGLTIDHQPIARRARRLNLDELVAGTLLRYPIYWDWTLKGYTTCEAALNQIVRCLEAQAPGQQLRLVPTGYIERQFRKLMILGRAWMAN